MNQFINDRQIAKRTAFWLIVLVSMVLWNQQLVLSGYMIALCMWMWWSGLSLRQAGKRLLLLLPFGAGTLLFLPWTIPGTVVWSVGPLQLSVEGLQLALILLLKMTNASLVLSLMLHQTAVADWLRSLRQLGMPPVMVDLLQVMMRYVDLIGEEIRSMVHAQRARGFQARGWFWSLANYRRFGELLGVLFVRTWRRSERVYQAMQSRGEREAEVAQDQTLQQRMSGRADWAIEMDQVAFRYPSGTRDVLRGIDLRIRSGSKTVLMGMNGAGKSTLISLLNGLAVADRGKYALFGQLIDSQNAGIARHGVGVVYQDPDDQLFSPTVGEDVAYGPRNMGLPSDEVEDRVRYALGAVGMREFADCSPFELSYGQKRRVAIAGVMAMRPAMMVLDEPMAYLDPRGRDELQALLEQLQMMGTTLLVATHDVDFAAEWADQVIILKEGKVLAQGTTDLLFDEQLVYEAGLHLPRLARPFRMLQGVGHDVRPRSVRQAAQWIWKLMMQKQQEVIPHDVREQDATNRQSNLRHQNK